MTTCKKLGLKALRLERQGKQLEASGVWLSAKSVAETTEAYEICSTRAKQSCVASKSEQHSAANSNTVA